MKAAGYEFPDGLHYHVEHQVWAQPLPDGTVRVGMTSLGAALAGELYMCRPKTVGSVVEQGRSIAVVELGKSIVSMKSPVSGAVVAVNEVLATHPERVHEDPYGAGWVAVLQPSAWPADQAALVAGEAVIPAMEHHAWLMQSQADDGL